MNCSGFLVWLFASPVTLCEVAFWAFALNRTEVALATAMRHCYTAVADGGDLHGSFEWENDEARLADCQARHKYAQQSLANAMRRLVGGAGARESI